MKTYEDILTKDKLILITFSLKSITLMLNQHNEKKVIT